MNNHKLQICLALSGLALASGAHADSLDPLTPHGLAPTPSGFLLQVYGLDANKTGQETPDGVLITSDSSLFSGVTTAGLTGTLNSFGGFSDLTSGKVGAFVSSPDGFGFEQVSSVLIVNVPFSGTGTAVLTFHVQALITGPADAVSSASFTGGIEAQAYDFVGGAPNLVGQQVGVGASLCNAIGDQTNSCAGGNTPVTQTSVDKDVSVTVPVDGTHSFYQILEEFTLAAGAMDNIDASHTGTLSIQTSPGVTFDNTDGFLTSTTEPTIAPEPGSIMLTVLGFGLIVGKNWKRRSVSRRHSQMKG